MGSRRKTALILEKLGEAVDRLREQLGDDHPDIIPALVGLANTCVKNAEDEEAIYYYVQALEMCNEYYGEGSCSVADILTSLAVAEDHKGYYSESLSHLEDALVVYQEAFEAGEVSWFKVANVLNEIGNVLFHEDQIEEAESKYMEALDMATEYGPGDDSTSCLNMHLADIYNNLGSISAVNEDWDKSIEKYSKAFDLQKSLFGEDDPAVAVTLNNIGTMNFFAGRYEMALKSYKQVLKMRRAILGNHDFSVSDALLNVGTVYKAEGDFERAGRAFGESLRIARIALETDEHEKIAEIFMNMGANAMESGDYEMASDKFDEALEIYEGLGYDEDHESIATIMEFKEHMG